MPVVQGQQVPKATATMMRQWLATPPRCCEPEVPVEIGATQPSSVRRVDNSGAQKGHAVSSYMQLNREEWIIKDEGSDATDDEVAAACRGESMRMGWPLKLLFCLSFVTMVAISAVFIVAGLGLARIPFISSVPSTDASASDAAAAALLKDYTGEPGGIADTIRATRARRLTDKYVQLRFSKDVMGMQHLFAGDIELHVDVSRAGMLVGMKIKSLLNFRSRLTGRDDVVNFCQALPAEPGDEQPRSESFQCVGDACVISATVHRPVVGSVMDIATLHWDPKEALLKRMDLSFWLQ